MVDCVVVVWWTALLFHDGVQKFSAATPSGVQYKFFHVELFIRTMRRRFLEQLYFGQDSRYLLDDSVSRRFSVHVLRRFFNFDLAALIREGVRQERGRGDRCRRAFSRADTEARSSPALRSSIQQSLARELAVHRLRARVLNRDTDACRQMAERYRGRNFIDVLAAGSA